jgi:hypothetical protein
MSKTYDEMTPAEKRAADRRTREAGENEVAGSRSYFESRGLKPVASKRDDKRGSRKMER